MRKIIVNTFLICFLCLANLTALHAQQQEPSTIAGAAILVDADNGDILLAKDPRRWMHPASTTKIMTAVLALESGKWDQPLVISQKAVNTEPSSLGLKMGDRITLGEAVAGMMVVSGNDAAVAVAETVGGSVDNFAQMMNDKAKELGMDNTRFLNPHGLTAMGQHTTPTDMAKLAIYAMKKPEFRAIVGRKAYNVKYMDGHTQYVTTTNRFLKSGYPGAVGIKTGFTNAAGDCLVAGAERNGKLLIAVFYDDDNRWTDAPAWFDYGFSLYQ